VALTPDGSADLGAQSRDDETGDAPKPSEKRDPKKVIEQAKRRFKVCEEAESDNRRLAREDYDFRQGKQWNDKDKADRSADGRPCLTINRIPQFINQVTNDQRQNRPSIKVHPIDDKGDIETAKVIQGLVKHVEDRSSADTAYDTATDGAATGGFGFFRILTEYASHKSFNQELRIKRLRNPFAAYLDPSHQEPDGSDANYGFTWDDLQSDEYRSQYPDSELAETREWESLDTVTPDWITGDSARVLEYFDRVMIPDTLYLLSDGSTVLKSEMNLRVFPDGVSITDQRPTKRPCVYWYKINGLEILEETEWVSKWIPIIPVYGAEYVDPNTGRVIREGVTRHAKDAQRMQNFYYSMEAETIALAPRTPFIGVEGQFEGHEEKWASANRRNHAFLEYKAKDLNGTPFPPPQRQAFEPPVGAITQAKAMAADDMKATTGIYDAALGQRSNENSGIAIQRRNQQSQTSNFHIVDNLSKSIRHAGRILVDAIPKVYDSERTARIIGDEGDQRVVKLNAAFEEKGKQVIYDMTVGEYDVAVDVGPSFATKRQEGSAAMLELSKSIPAIGQAAPDLILKSMDVPGAQEMADRMKKTLPAGLADGDDKDHQQPIPPQIQAQMEHMSKMVESQTQEIHALSQLVETKKMELESRERIEMAKIQSQIALKEAELGSKEAMALLAHQVAEIENRLSLLNFDQPIDTDSGPEGAGGMSAYAPEEGQPPTGGEPPGQPMEGSNVDQSLQ
jgi:hypothetical protein